MKIIPTIIITLISCSTLSAQSGWFTQQTGTDITLRSVFMTDKNTGYCAGGDILIDDNNTAVDRGIILKTTNGGVNWTIQSPPNFDKILYSVTFPDSQTGYAVGRDASLYAIFKTTNGGMNWIQQEPPPSAMTPPLYSVYFISTETGYTSGAGGKIFKTTNGGMNWTAEDFPDASQLYSITFTSPGTGFAGSDNNVYRTTNGGINWSVTLTSSGITFQSVFFLNQNTGYAAGSNKIFKTTNGGDNWTSKEITGNSFTSIYFPSANTGYCAGEFTAIYRTTNGGNNWTLQTETGGTPLYSVFFSNDTMGYAAGNVGFMLRTTNGGTVGITAISEEIPEGYKLHQNYPNPFNPETIIEYDINERTKVELSIYDVTGKQISQPIKSIQSAGRYRYTFDGESLPSGIYIYRLRTDDFFASRKMILLK